MLSRVKLVPCTPYFAGSSVQQLGQCHCKRPCAAMSDHEGLRKLLACIATIPCIALLPFGTDIRSVRMSRECDDVCSRFPPHASESTCRACCVAFARATCARCVFLQLPHDHAFVGRGQTTRPVTAKSGRSSGHFHDVGNGFATQPRKDTTVWLKGAITQTCEEMLLGSPHLGHLRRYMPRPSSTRTSRSTCRRRWVAQSSSKLRRADDCSVV